MLLGAQLNKKCIMVTNNSENVKNKNIRIRIPQITLGELDAKAKTYGLTRNALILVLINQYLNGQIEIKL